MSAAVSEGLDIIENAPIPTWFKIGGRAERLARPGGVEELGRVVEWVRKEGEAQFGELGDGARHGVPGHQEMGHGVRVLGDGANLLVDDDGVGGVVVELSAPAFTGWQIDAKAGTARVGAGAKLPQLIHAAGKAGLGGLEVLGGIPATVGGAIVMNAGGVYGQIADVVSRVYAVDHAGRQVSIERGAIDFGYRHSGLNHLTLTHAELTLTPDDPEKLRKRLLEIMEYKKQSQPMKANSAGCCFKNPTLARDVEGLGAKGQRVSAGMVIDRAGLKGLAVGGASVSPVHANFIVTAVGAAARDVIGLMVEIARRVNDQFGVELEREVVVWSRGA